MKKALWTNGRILLNSIKWSSLRSRDDSWYQR